MGEVRVYVDKFAALATACSDLVVGELFMTAVTVGFVVTAFAPTKVIVLAGIALKGHGREFTALVGAVTKWLVAAATAHAEIVFLALFEGHFDWRIVCDDGIGHGFSH